MEIKQSSNGYSTPAIDSYNKKNKANIARTIAVIYDPKNNVPNYIKDMIVARLLWATTEHTDDEQYKKYEGQPYWSIEAIRLFAKNKRTGEKNIYADLRHEHSVPKKEITRKIKDSDRKEETIYRILDNLAHAVVVTKEEDEGLNKKFRSTMPRKLEDNSRVDNVFSRYLETGRIKVCDVRGKDLRRITSGEIEEMEKNAITCSLEIIEVEEKNLVGLVR